MTTEEAPSMRVVGEYHDATAQTVDGRPYFVASFLTVGGKRWGGAADVGDGASAEEAIAWLEGHARSRGWTLVRVDDRTTGRATTFSDGARAVLLAAHKTLGSIPLAVEKRHRQDVTDLVRGGFVKTTRGGAPTRTHFWLTDTGKEAAARLRGR